MSGVTCIRPRREFVLSDCGDSAVRLTSMSADAEERWHVVHTVAAALDARGDEVAVTGIIPTYDALLVEFDCGATTHDAIRAHVERLIELPADAAARGPRQFEIPVVYGENSAPTSTRWQHTSNSHPPR